MDSLEVGEKWLITQRGYLVNFLRINNKRITLYIYFAQLRHNQEKYRLFHTCFKDLTFYNLEGILVRLSIFIYTFHCGISSSRNQLKSSPFFNDTYNIPTWFVRTNHNVGLLIRTYCGLWYLSRRRKMRGTKSNFTSIAPSDFVICKCWLRPLCGSSSTSWKRSVYYATCSSFRWDYSFWRLLAKVKNVIWLLVCLSRKTNPWF